MNYGRIAMVAVAAFIADAIYGLLVYGTLLTSEFAMYPAVFRPPSAQTAYLPMLFLGTLLGMFVMAYIYARGYEGGNSTQEGLRFGVLIGLFNAGYVVMVGYATLQIDLRLTGLMAIAGLVEWTIVGIVMGMIYKPLTRTQPARRGAGV